MKITFELLSRYRAGKCNPKEKSFVESWLNAELDKEDLKYVSSFHLSRDKVLNNILDDIGEAHPYSNISPKPTPSPIYQRVRRISIAACFALIFYAGGALLPNPFTKEVSPVKIVEAGYPEPEPALYVSTLNGTPERISAGEYNISFEGLIRLHSVGKKNKRVVCNGKEIILEPNQDYYVISQSSNSVRKLVHYDEHLLEGYSQRNINAKNFEVCVKG